MISRRVFHSFRWVLQPVKHISSLRFARLSSHLLCNATVPAQFHLAVTLSFNWQVTTTICNNLWNFCTRARQFPNRSELRRDESWKTRSRNLFGFGFGLGFCVLCWLWQLVLWHFDYATDAFTSYKFFNKSDKSKTPPTLSQATRGATRVEFIWNPCPKLQHLSHNTQTGSGSAEQPSKKSKHP